MKPCMVCHIFRAEIFCTGRVVAQWPSLQRKQALALREMARLILDAHQSSKTSMSFFFCFASLWFLGGFPGNREVKRPCAHVWISHTSSQPSAIMPDGCPHLIHVGQCFGRRRAIGNALRTCKDAHPVYGEVGKDHWAQLVLQWHARPRRIVERPQPWFRRCTVPS